MFAKFGGGRVGGGGRKSPRFRSNYLYFQKCLLFHRLPVQFAVADWCSSSGPIHSNEPRKISLEASEKPRGQKGLLVFPNLGSLGIARQVQVRDRQAAGEDC